MELWLGEGRETALDNLPLLQILITVVLGNSKRSYKCCIQDSLESLTPWQTRRIKVCMA